ncbi:C-type lectin domain family 4 member M-like [Amphibalanus amphitrite]|uniref:C-type lectin domain family 4 member M-like n=1 Tax=Amphibalanus amphitrite TaxID=1232801 RepID=UPI001C908BFF|nr:C-type lectin domain family 4 member M-like [Amphibalanus amphitrite]
MQSAALLCVCLAAAVAGSTLTLQRQAAVDGSAQVTRSRLTRSARVIPSGGARDGEALSDPDDATSLTAEDYQTASNSSLRTTQFVEIIIVPYNASSGSARQGRIFLPRRGFVKTCLSVTPQGDDGDDGVTLQQILDAINNSKDMLSSGQTSILQAIAGISTGTDTGESTGTCDLSGLTAGQTSIMMQITSIDTELDQLGGILTAVNTAKDMIIAGQATINTNIADLDSDLDTAKTMIISGQSTINTNIAGISTELSTTKTMILAGQSTISTAIATLSTDLSTTKSMILAAIADLDSDISGVSTAISDAKTMILAGQTTINTNIADLDSDLETAKTMIIAGQSTINTNIAGISTELSTTKTMILDGQSTISTSIATLSTDLSTAKSMILAAIADLDSDVAAVNTAISDAKTMILAGQTTINNNIAGLATQITNTEATITTQLDTINTKIDALETGQQEICDKIEALDAKLDTILAKLMDGMTTTCPDGATESGGQCFTISTDRDSLDNAAAACETTGGTLATMTAENAAVIYGLANSLTSKRVWIGLTTEAGSWKWEDGSTYGTFLDWEGGTEPPALDMRCGEAVATSSTEGDWESQPCTANRNFICSTAAT